jgi:hypothetical protein
MEAFTIVLSVTQLFYVLSIKAGGHGPVPVERHNALGR